MTTPFKILVQNEMHRLQTLVVYPQETATYAVPSYRYAVRKGILRKQIPYTGFISLTRTLRFFLF